MSRTVLVVESENDKFFLEAYIEHISKSNDIEVKEPVCSIDDFECLEGFNPVRLGQRLESIKRESKKRDISTIGIVIDADQTGVDQRKQEVEDIVTGIDFDPQIKIDIFIMNINGHGDLETVLKHIAKGERIYAECLERWQECLKEQGKKELNQKEFDKFWIQIYQRYDCCSNQEKKQAGRKCGNKASMKKDIWNFDHTALDKLKEFLNNL